MPKMGRLEIIEDIKSKLRPKEDGGPAEWPPGFKLPSTRALAEHYGVSTATIDTVLLALAGEGITFNSVAGGRRWVPGAPPDETTGGLTRSDVEEQLRKDLDDLANGGDPT